VELFQGGIYALRQA